MIDFVDTFPFSRIALLVAMETMHLNRRKKVFFLRTKYFQLGGPHEQFDTHENCPGVQGRSNQIPL